MVAGPGLARLTRMRWRLFLPAAYGTAIGAAYALSWSILERAWTLNSLKATAIMTAAGLLAGIAALWLMRALDGADKFTRFAAALLVLPAATTVFAAFGLFAERLIHAERVPFDTWLQPVLWIISLALSAAFLFLAIAGLILLPLGVLLMVLFAVLFAARPEESAPPRAN